MFGINGSEFVVLLVVAVVVLGPERLPQYTMQLTTLIRELRRMALGAQQKVRDELGPEFDEVDWRALDPRQYDPRRIVREALSDAVDLDDPLGLRASASGLSVDAAGLSANLRSELDSLRASLTSLDGMGSARRSPAVGDKGVADGADPLPAFDPDAT